MPFCIINNVFIIVGITSCVTLSCIFFNLQALSKTLTFDELVYLKEQFSLLEPSTNGFISIEAFKTVSYLKRFFLFF